MKITAIKVTIRTEANWAVGATDAAVSDVDRELLVDREGHPWIPASSLAGSLRAHLAAHGADERLMGSRPPRDRRTRDPLMPSALSVLGTQLRANSKHPRPLRTNVVASTAIDPVRQAAHPRSLRSSRVVDEPASIEVYLMYAGELPDADRSLLESWRPSVGRDRTRGGGTAKLHAIAYRRYDLDNHDDLHAWLSAPGPGRFRDAKEQPIPRQPDPTVLSATFEIVDAVHIGTGTTRKRAADYRARSGMPLIPGSTWKGIFRSRAGYILRTRFGADIACCQQDGCATCLLCDLFGSTARRGRLAFADSPIHDAKPAIQPHVAIDRVSGGSRDKLLFSQHVVGGGKLTLQVRALGTVSPWERLLQLHVIRDIDDGLLGVGGGAMRGHGTLRLVQPKDLVAALEPVEIPGEPGDPNEVAS